jgi:hypothetical protein
MAHSALARPAAVYSATAGLAILSVCGFVTGLRLYMPHHRPVEAQMSVITTPAPAIPTVAPTQVAVAQLEPASPPHHSHAKRDQADAVTDASAPIGDQADAAALTPAAVNDADAPVAEQAEPTTARPDETQPQPSPGPALDQDR